MKRRIETIIKKIKAQYDSVGKPNHDIMKVVHKGNMDSSTSKENRLSLLSMIGLLPLFSNKVIW